MKSENENKRVFTTNSGIPLKRTYHSRDLADYGFSEDVNLCDAGQYPFKRGISSEMYRDELWVMGQYSGFGSADEANKRYRYLLEQGQTGFSIALDLPTQIGLDSDHELSAGEVGKVGVAIDSLEDIERLFDGIPLEKVRQIRTTANAIGPIMAALLIAFSEKNDIDPNMIRILLQNDPLKEYFARGAYIFPPEASVKLAVDVIEYCADRLTNWVPMALSGYHIRESGGTAVQELAFCFANGVGYFEEAARRNLHVDRFAPKLYTFFSSGLELLEEVAKFRAARAVWAKTMKERYGAQNAETMKLSILAYTAGGLLTAQQPLNNIVRVTIEAMAAVLGGVQTLATSSFDEAFSIPTEQAVTVALRTQQILAHESGVTKTVDLLGGSYALESLTCEIEKRVDEYLERIEQLGGPVACIEQGFFQRELAREAYQHQKAVENKEKLIVGVNSFKSDEIDEIPLFSTDPHTEEAQSERLKVLRKNRDHNKLQSLLDVIQQDARLGKNLIPSMIEALKEYATIGEITDCLKEVYGVYKDPGIY